MCEVKKIIGILHDDIHRKLLILVAGILEVLEEVILDLHRPGSSTTNYRYVSFNMKYCEETCDHDQISFSSLIVLSSLWPMYQYR